MTATKDQAEVVELEVLKGSSGNALEALTRGEVDIQVATARRFPRSLKLFKERALEMATLDEETAEACIYALPRDGKTIEGPSARLAEILASAYGHMRIEGRPISEDDRFITAQGRAWDIQNNVAISFETRRRIAGKNGKKFSDDMVTVTANAATSIALRNAILKVIPKAFWGPVYEACRKVAVGDASTLVNRRKVMVDYFAKMGVTPDRVFALLDVRGVEDITLDHLAKLKGLATAIKEGDTTVDESFPLVGDQRDHVEEELAAIGGELADQLRALFASTRQSKGQALAFLRQYKGKTADLIAVLQAIPTPTNGAAEKKTQAQDADSGSSPADGGTIPSVPNGGEIGTPKLGPRPVPPAAGKGRFQI